MANDQDFIGMLFSDALALARERGVTLRTMQINDEFMMGTQDYRLDRLDIAVRDDVVVSVKNRRG